MDEKLKELLEKSAHPHLIASAKTANMLLSELNAVIADLRAQVGEMKLANELYEHKLYKELKEQGKTDKFIELEYRVSEIYRDWQRKDGQLKDIRAIRRNLDSHAKLLTEQEIYGQKYGNYNRVIN